MNKKWKILNKIMTVVAGIIMMFTTVIIMAIGILAMKGNDVELDGSARMWIIMLPTVFAALSCFTSSLRIFGYIKDIK